MHNRTLGIKYAVYINGLIWKEVLMKTDKDIYSPGKEKALSFSYKALHIRMKVAWSLVGLKI